MIILGIDPAIRCTGYAVIDIRSAGSFSVIDCGIIRNAAKMAHSECLRRLAGGVDELVDNFKPEAASIEEPFMGKNAGTAIILGMARGAILMTLARAGVPVYPYAPRKAKKAAVGAGSASKERIAAMMAAEFGVDVARIPLDATDALALALCHGHLAIRGDTAALLLPKPL